MAILLGVKTVEFSDLLLRTLSSIKTYTVVIAERAKEVTYYTALFF